jgi:hypothetical protein
MRSCFAPPSKPSCAKIRRNLDDVVRASCFATPSGSRYGWLPESQAAHARAHILRRAARHRSSVAGSPFDEGPGKLRWPERCFGRTSDRSKACQLPVEPPSSIFKERSLQAAEKWLLALRAITLPMARLERVGMPGDDMVEPPGLNSSAVLATLLTWRGRFFTAVAGKQFNKILPEGPGESANARTAPRGSRRKVHRNLLNTMYLPEPRNA